MMYIKCTIVHNVANHTIRMNKTTVTKTLENFSSFNIENLPAQMQNLMWVIDNFKSEQVRQCAYNVILKRVHVTIVAMRSLCIVELRVTVNNVKILSVPQKKNCSYGEFMTPATTKTYLGLHVKCPIILSDFNQIWSSLTCFHRSIRYEMSRRSVQLNPRWYMRTDGQTDRQTGRWTDGRTWPS
jgi:hypothetical protein